MSLLNVVVLPSVVFLTSHQALLYLFAFFCPTWSQDKSPSSPSRLFSVLHKMRLISV